VAEPARPAEAVRTALAAGLKQAMKARDPIAVETLRSLLSALDNASAIARPAGADHYGSGPTEAARHEASAEEIAALFTAETAERVAAAADYRQRGQIREAARLDAQIAVIAAFTGALPALET
jgi:hypothetical protein